MITCMIIDDEPLAVQLLKSYVGKMENMDTVADFSNPLEGLQFIQNNGVDIIFLDIQMPELNGVQFAKVIGDTSKIIFTTAYPSYAVEGFEVKALDFLVKPISFVRFVDAVNRYQPKVSSANNDIKSKDHIFVRTEYRLQKVDLRDISYIKGMGDYSLIVYKGGKIMTLEKLKHFEKKLPVSQFIRVHKSYIVAIGKIEFIEKCRIKISDQYIPIGATFEKALKGRIG